MVLQANVDRFQAELDKLIEPGARVGVAVSGGPDSMALLVLAAEARPSAVEAATVDHGLRETSRAEAEMVANVCQRLGVPHSILAVEWDCLPAAAIQEKARQARYGALTRWMRDRKLPALVTGHHLDDQAETFLMRLNRGSGVRGLAGMRSASIVPGDPGLMLLRPLLEWRRAELEETCAQANLAPVADPSNSDEKHERVRIRQSLAKNAWLDAEAIARSAEHLGSADEAIAWAADREWSEFVEVCGDELVYRPSVPPMEIVRRVLSRAIAGLGTEGSPGDLRGREVDRLIADLQACNTTTLRGVRCSGGLEWRFKRATPRARS